MQPCVTAISVYEREQPITIMVLTTAFQTPAWFGANGTPVHPFGDAASDGPRLGIWA
jgi:hypothetical protein